MKVSRGSRSNLLPLDGIISLPICIAGFFILPDTPDRPNPRAKWLRPQDVAIGRERMARIKRVEQVGFSPRSFVQSFSSWVPWVFAPMYVCFVLGLGSFACEWCRRLVKRAFIEATPLVDMNLWLKSTKLYTTAQVNVIPTGGYALQLVAAAVYSWTSDAIGMRWPVILFGGCVALIGNTILTAWPASLHAKYAGFFLAFTVTPCGALTLSWANELVSQTGAEHRAIVIGFLNTVGPSRGSAWSRASP